jgi:hypothetical protein
MKKLIALLITAFLLSSCNAGNPEVIPNEEPAKMQLAVAERSRSFSSEEEFTDFVLNEGRGEMSTHSTQNVDALTYYYKLANLPPDITFRAIFPEGDIVYETQELDTNGRRERISIMYSPHWSYDIETRGFWINPDFPDESYMFEEEGLKYYIARVLGWNKSYSFWKTEWVNRDGYHMIGSFPYRFTPEEVLSYISNIERVDIVPPSGGTQYATE